MVHPRMHPRCICYIRHDFVRSAKFSQRPRPSPKLRDPPEISAKPFSSIPGPQVLPLIGSLYNYIPGGRYYGKPLHKQGMLKYEKYGSLVRETFLPGKTVLWVFDPRDMETLFVNEMLSPERRSHLALKKFRKDRPHVYNDGGLLPTNGEEWWRLRREFQKGLSALPCVRSYLPVSDEIIKNFVHEVLLQGEATKRTPIDFLPLVSRLFLELIGIVAFDTKLNSFSPEELQPNSKSSRLLKAVEDANSFILPLDNTEESWMKSETRDYKKFVEAMLVMEEVAIELVQAKIDAIRANRAKTPEDEKKVPSLFEMYLSSPELDSKDVVGMAVDMLLAGIDTTAYTSCYAMFYLAKCQTSQLTVLREATGVLGPPMSDTPITPQVLNYIPFTRAVLKEVLRLSPISVGVGRITTQDMVLSGYHIPAKTQVVTQNEVACLLAENFRHPSQFVPGRWLKGHPLQASVNPYLVLPFGHGARACIARRLAEQHLLTLMLRVVHSLSFTWSGKKMLGCTMGHINKPDGPVLCSIKRRTRGLTKNVLECSSYG